MKAKYNRMVDEYVKKHYGDLDRGVLSDEVKYKVLFKIYRKKYKKEKALRKSIEKMHRYTPTVTHPVAPYPDGFPDTVDSSMCDKSLCLTCSHMYTEHNGARHCTLGREVTETRVGCANYETHPDCVHCKHSKMNTLTDYMGAATSILYCEKKKHKCDLIDSQMCEYFEEKKNE